MRNPAIGFALVLGVAVPQHTWAESPAAPQSSRITAGAAAGDQLRVLFEKLDIGLIAKAWAVECKDEGEICRSNAECCSGLQCSGDPQTTCRPQE